MSIDRFKCFTSGKVRFASDVVARRRGAEILAEGDKVNGATRLYTYECDGCGGWHLTRSPKLDQVAITAAEGRE